MKRILVLHGYGQNAPIFYKRLSALRKHCSKDCEFVFADALLILKAVDLPQNLSSIGAAEATTQETDNEDPELIPRGWWLRDKSATMDECIVYLRDLVSNQTVPFTGVFGFSQGASAAALLAALLESPDAIPEFGINGTPPHPPLKFCIAVAGFRPRGVKIDPLLDQGIQTPLLHVVGVNDQIVVPERIQSLNDVCRNLRVEKHEGGHFVPTKLSWRQFFGQYFNLDDHMNSGSISSPNPLLTANGSPATSNDTLNASSA